MNIKYLNRKIRIMRLLAVVNAFHHYMVMEVNRELLRHSNSWQKAEFLSDLINALIPYNECSPTDFMFDKDELSDIVLDNYEEFKKWVENAKNVGIKERALMALCKNVYNSWSLPQLKMFGHILYSNWLMALYLYLENEISKTELQNIFVEYSLFSRKKKPANLAIFRKVIIEIEAKISQITYKQDFREFKQMLTQLGNNSA